MMVEVAVRCVGVQLLAGIIQIASVSQSMAARRQQRRRRRRRNYRASSGRRMSQTVRSQRAITARRDLTRKRFALFDNYISDCKAFTSAGHVAAPSLPLPPGRQTPLGERISAAQAPAATPIGRGVNWRSVMHCHAWTLACEEPTTSRRDARTPKIVDNVSIISIPFHTQKSTTLLGSIVCQRYKNKLLL